MFPLPEFLDVQSYHSTRSGWEVVIVSCLVASFFSIYVAILSYRSALKSRSSAFLWCGHFALVYGFWNIFFLSHFAQRDLSIFNTSVSTDFTHKAYLALGVLLTSFAHACVKRIYQSRYLITNRLHIFNIFLACAIFFIPAGVPILYLTAFYAIVSFGGLSLLNWKIWSRYHRAQEARLKTKSLFLGLGMTVCLSLSFLGQLRAEFLPHWKIPYLGNIVTVVFLFFIYQMIAHPRLREIRELMIRGGRIIVLTLILSSILILLLIWVGQNKAELFFFNTFLASFIILSILEPVESRIDRFILKKISTDRLQFQNVVQSTIRKIKRSRTSKQLSYTLLQGIRETDRVYQSALYLWDPASETYRINSKSSLKGDSQIEPESALVSKLAKTKRSVLREGAEDSADHELLRAVRAHLIFGIYQENRLMGLWLIRSSLSSDSDLSSFSNAEVDALKRLVHEFSLALDQLNYFEKHDQQQRLAALGEMSAALAHEIRNPLGAIQGATSLLQTSPSLENSEDKECVRILAAEIERLQATVDQYLHFARKNQTSEQVLLKSILQSAVDASLDKANKTKTSIHFEPPDDRLRMTIDRLKLEQVLINLIVNACEAFAKNVWLRFEVDSDILSLRVQDDGPGIPPHVLPNIFTPLFTTKKAGSGLGLPICKKIIDSLGGEITVTSGHQKGSEFRIRFPSKHWQLSTDREEIDSTA